MASIRRFTTPFEGGQIWAALCLLVMTAAQPHAAEQSADGALVEHMRAGGHVLFIRHAKAPGTGDPEGFRVEDCATQRNLSEAGRAQAREIGAWLRTRGVGGARVYSSQWCRCLDTARLLEVGPVTQLPALNSFYERPQDREPNLAALRRFLAEQPADGTLLVLVTHQVTISAMTGEYAPSGHAVLAELGPRGELKPVGQLDFAQ